MADNQYIVAVRRERRADTPTDWAERLNKIDGVSVVGSSPKRAQVKATNAGIEKLRADFGERVLIEPVILHHTQES